MNRRTLFRSLVATPVALALGARVGGASTVVSSSIDAVYEHELSYFPLDDNITWYVDGRGRFALYPEQDS